jgi:hypothetical protein
MPLLVLASPATHRLLENNPRLGLSVFTAVHPQNGLLQWKQVVDSQTRPILWAS